MREYPVTLTRNDVAALLASRLSQVRVPLMRHDFIPAREVALARAKPSDLLWAQEEFTTWRAKKNTPRTFGLEGFGYGGMLDAPKPPHLKNVHCASRHWQAERMQRFQSRFTLEVISVRRETLINITAEDALASGVIPVEIEPGVTRYRPISDMPFSPVRKAADAYLDLWHETHFGDARGPVITVLVITFRAWTANIEDVLSAQQPQPPAIAEVRA